MTTTFRRISARVPRPSRWLTVGAIALLTTLATATTAGAQATAEGTVITNTATASYTDANGNTYTNATASVSVTVGFAAGVDATSPATVTPASPSTGNQLDFAIQNTGNGTDQDTVVVSAGAGLTITGYKYAGTTYATQALLNAVLVGVNTTAGSSITVSVLYDVAAAKGGATMPITLTARSVRTPATQDASTTNVAPPTSGSVAVTPDAGTIDQLPSNGTQYTQAFAVQNTGNASDVFNLAATLSAGTTITIVSVNGTAGASSTVSVASGASASVNVVYTVATAAAAGTTQQITLTATSTNTPAQSNPGDVTVRVVKAALGMTKVAYRDNQTTVINNTTDRVLPGEFIQYKITVANSGLANASTVSITDALPAAVTYNVASGDVPADWSISQVAGTVTASLTPALAPAGSRYIWIRVQVK